MMDHKKLADDMKGALGFGGPTSEVNVKIAKDIVDHLKTGKVMHPVVTGAGPNGGGPIAAGAAPAAPGANIILVPQDLVSRFSKSFGASSKEITGFATAISSFLAGMGIDFAPGTITGTTAGAAFTASGAGGKVVGLVGVALAQKMASGINQGSVSDGVSKLGDIIAKFVQTNAQASYPMGGLSGTASPSGGPISGTGQGGSLL